eukprot:9446029-Alexandrium_andersonii.AAC.1
MGPSDFRRCPFRGVLRAVSLAGRTGTQRPPRLSKNSPLLSHARRDVGWCCGPPPNRGGRPGVGHECGAPIASMSGWAWRGAEFAV